jgi:hypothetical protein
VWEKRGRVEKNKKNYKFFHPPQKNLKPEYFLLSGLSGESYLAWGNTGKVPGRRSG